MKYRSLWLLAVVALAGCGGGGSQATLPAAAPQTVSASHQATLTMSFGGPSAQTVLRRADAAVLACPPTAPSAALDCLDGGIVSVTVNVFGAFTTTPIIGTSTTNVSGPPACNVAAPAARTCTIVVPAPTGADFFQVLAYTAASSGTLVMSGLDTCNQAVTSNCAGGVSGAGYQIGAGNNQIAPVLAYDVGKFALATLPANHGMVTGTGSSGTNADGDLCQPYNFGQTFDCTTTNNPANGTMPLLANAAGVGAEDALGTPLTLATTGTALDVEFNGFSAPNAYRATITETAGSCGGTGHAALEGKFHAAGAFAYGGGTPLYMIDADDLPGIVLDGNEGPGYAAKVTLQGAGSNTASFTLNTLGLKATVSTGAQWAGCSSPSAIFDNGAQTATVTIVETGHANSGYYIAPSAACSGAGPSSAVASVKSTSGVAYTNNSTAQAITTGTLTEFVVTSASLSSGGGCTITVYDANPAVANSGAASVTMGVALNTSGGTINL